MKLCYQVATPDVDIAPTVTAYQGDIQNSFKKLKECGYNGAELMVCNPAQIDVNQVIALSKQYHLDVPMVCTGEIFGQDKLSFSDPDDEVRNEALARAKAAIDVAGKLGAQINIGRLRGGYVWGVPAKTSYKRSVDAFYELTGYAEKKNVIIALEPVNSIAINFINSTLEGIEMVRKINSPYFRLMLDSNHMYIDDIDMLESIEQAKGYFTYVHLVDSNRLYPGNCKLDFKSFIDALKNVGYDGYLSVEVFQRPDQDTALKKSYEHIKPLIY